MDSVILYNEEEAIPIEKETEQDISTLEHLGLSPSKPPDASTPSSLEQHKIDENET